MDSTAGTNRSSKYFRTQNSQPHRVLRSLASARTPSRQAPVSVRTTRLGENLPNDL